MEDRPIYSAEITEIIGTPPSWIMRVGSGLLLLLLLTFIGLSNIISIPERSYAALTITGTTQPYYIVQSAGNRLLVNSGQVVEKGQPILGNASTTMTSLRAPFRGTIFYESDKQPPQPIDTLAVLVPLTNTYSFSGKIGISELRELRNRGMVQVEVPLADRPEGNLYLHGQLSYIHPVVHNGVATYKGHLDSASDAVLLKQLAFVTNLDGRLLLHSNRKTLLKHVFN